MVRLVALLQAAQNRDGVLDVGLAHVDDLETALQRGILLDVLAVLVERGGADGAQLAARQRRLEHVAGVDGAFGRAGADQRMQLVDEEDDLAVRLFDLLQDRLEAVFKLAAILGAGEHRSQIERDDALVAQNLGHVAGDDAAREAFDDGGFAHAGLADEHGVVLGAAAEHLDDAANLFVAADDRVELAAAGEFGQVLGVFFQRLEFAFGVLVGDALRSAHRGERLQDGFVRGAGGDQRIARGIALQVRDAEQQVLGGDVLVFEVVGLLEGLVERFVERLAQAGLRGRAGYTRQFLLDRCRSLSSRSVGTPIFSSTGGDYALAVLEQSQQQMHGLELGVAELGRAILRLLHRLLRLDGEFVPTNSHFLAPSFQLLALSFSQLVVAESVPHF